MTVKRFISFLLTVAMMVLLAGCSSTDENTDKSESIKSETAEKADDQTNEAEGKDRNGSETSSADNTSASADVSDTDKAGDVTDTGTIQPQISGELSIKADFSDAVKEEGYKYILTKGGEYHVRGTCTNRMIYVDAKDQELDIHLEGVNMMSETGALIFVENAEKVTISASEGTNNELTDCRPARTNKNEDSDNGNAAIYSKDDLKFKGHGRLTVTSSYNNAIGCKNDIKIKNLTLSVNAENNGIKGNDSVTIESGNITINAVKGNGIKTENKHISDKGNQKGYITISGGVIDITSDDEPFDAAFDLVIDSANATVTTNKK